MVQGTNQLQSWSRLSTSVFLNDFAKHTIFFSMARKLTKILSKSAVCPPQAPKNVIFCYYFAIPTLFATCLDIFFGIFFTDYTFWLYLWSRSTFLRFLKHFVCCRILKNTDPEWLITRNDPSSKNHTMWIICMMFHPLKITQCYC